MFDVLLMRRKYRYSTNAAYWRGVRAGKRMARRRRRR